MRAHRADRRRLCFYFYAPVKFMHRSILILLAMTPLFGQVADLATDYTGSNLVFWTRFRLQSETDTTNQQKVYRWRDGEWSRLTVFDDRGQLTPGGIFDPFVAKDGGVYGWAQYPPSSPGIGAIRTPNKTVITGITLPNGFPTEYFSISSNGRYIAGGTYDFFLKWQAELLDTKTGVRTPWKIENLPAIADDGTLAYVFTRERSNGLRIVASGKRPQFFQVGGAAGSAVISPNAQWAAVAIGSQVRVYSTSTGDSVDFAPGSRIGLNSAWRLSNTRALFLSPDLKQLLSLDPATRKTTVVMDSPSDLFADLALSGDGNVAYAVTETNQLWRFDLTSGTSAEILSPLPSSIYSAQQPNFIIGEVVRGSSMQLQGKYTKEQTVSVDGQGWPISTIDDSGLWFQIPWEYRTGPTNLTVRTPGNPFEAVLALAQASEFIPYFLTRVDPNTTQITAVAAHTDFSGVVTVAQPAHPGELVHMYMTGLGPLAHDVPTGAKGPPDGVPTTHSLTCYSTLPGNPARTPLTVFSAVYAPNMIGFYQVDLAVPANAPDGFVVVHCGDSTVDRVGWLPTRP